jgi:hypothetical protein
MLDQLAKPLVCCYMQVMCNSTELRESISGVLFGAAKRCLGLQPSCELLQQPGDLQNATTAGSSDGNAGKAADSPLQQQDRNSTQETAASTTNSTSSSGSSSSDQQAAVFNLGNSVGMSELAAALQQQAAAPHMAPDPFMPLVPKPVETAASVVVLATPDEIEEAAARNGSRSRIVDNVASK